MTANQSRQSKRTSVVDSASPSAGPSGRRVRRKVNRGLTCANCRTRKTRCDGRQPGCKTCEVYEDQCRYDQLPPLSQIRSLTQRLQDAEAMIKELQANHPARSSQPTTLSPPQHEPTAQLSPITDAPPHDSLQTVSATMQASDSVPPYMTNLDSLWNQPESPGQFLIPPTPLPITAQIPSAYVPTRTRYPAISNERSRAGEDSTYSLGQIGGGGGMPADLSSDGKGGICYFGVTSNVHEPPTESPDSIRDDLFSSKTDVRTMLTRNARESRQWEAFASGSAAIRCGIPPEKLNELLATHWTWIGPTFMWVYRPAFMRDMAKGGQYFSEFLLIVLCAHSARFAQDPAIGEMLISRARLMLGGEIDKNLSIPTVQALLQLSARDLAYGRISQAWLYSGMGFRMVSDLGLHHSASKISGLGQLGPEDLEIRRRLFWSCYFWDKAISLYLGRMPVLLDLPPESAPELLDDTVEHEIWSPFNSNNSANINQNYPGYKSHAISCFINSCKLSVIINSIIQQLYSRRTNPDIEAVLPTIPRSLDEWRQNTPSHLIIDPDNLPEFCPPPNILTQNLLYYTTRILLHRPFLSSPHHRQICRESAIQTEKLLRLLESTFSFTRITYLMAYCIYTSASVLLNDVKAGEREASQRMQTLLRALRGGIATCPILQRSLDIITNSLNSTSNGHTAPDIPGRFSVPQDRSSTGSYLQPPPTTGPPVLNGTSSSALPTFFDHQDEASSFDNNTISTNLLPAFLFAETSNDPTASLFSGCALGNDPFSALECFPENRLDGFQSDWFLP